MNELHGRKNIEQALKGFQRDTLAINAKNLLNTLGYESEITMDFESSLAEEFISYFDEYDKLNTERALVDEWKSIDFLFQLTEEEISGTGQTRITFKNRQLDNTIIESYVFFALKLRKSNYTRTQLSNITREINRLTPMPAMIIFQHAQTLTLAVVDRRLHKRDESKDVLEKVTLIKDIDSHDPHPAHIKILFDLSLNELFRVHGFSNFVELHRAWAKTLDIQELNKQFYRELSNWYFWAVDNVTFPEDADEDVEIRNATSVIRLITRLIFVWFIKEKKLIPDIFFNLREIEEILINTDSEESTYYKAILQNLFFATLNQEMNTPEKSNNRKFRGKGRQHYNITSLYRYEEYFSDPDEALQQFEKIPFLNGGLFECLDKEGIDDPKKILRIDGFSDRADNQLSVPNFLFFSQEKDVDLNEIYDTKGKRYKVRGLIEILRRYKFTITENTPVEEEVALDPELLGKVFENLLAAYNPETGATARKQTGSFYTPREIVNYMVDESLIVYLKSKLIAYYESENTFSITNPPSQLDFSGQANPVQTELGTEDTALSDKQKSKIEDKLRHLIAYKDEPHQFDADETEQLIKAIDTLKILDPACGSGAFPMGILHKLVFILGKLDPGNDQWRRRQIVRIENLIKIAEEIDDSTIRENTIQDLEAEIGTINEAFARNELDYGRKLYLIENCIYGVDIQPIAAQIARLRFFISLVVNQRFDDSRANRGIRPLPNLETKLVAGNTLIGVDKPVQIAMRNPDIDRKEKELVEIRRKHVTARTPKTKEKYRNLDQQIRDEISELLKRDGFPSETIEKIASWDPYNQNVFAEFFDPEWMFGITNGFDIVIGNPPYIGERRNEKIFHEVARTEFGKKFYTRWMDYFYFFFHRSLDVGRRKSIIAFITTNYFITATGADKLRRDLYERATIRNIISFNELKIFESSQGQHNAITIAIKEKIKTGKAKNCLTKRIGIATPEILKKIVDWKDPETQYYEVSQEQLYEGQDLQIRINGYGDNNSDPIQSILEKIKKQPNALGDLCHVLMGLVSRADKVSSSHLKKYPDLKAKKGDGIFVISSKELESLNLGTGDYTKYVRPFYKNSDIGKYFNEVKNTLWLLYVKDEGIPIKLSQELKTHFEKFETLLTKGKENFLKNKIASGFVRRWLKNGNYFVLFNPKEEEYFTGPKIIAPYRSRRNTFSYNEIPWFASQDVCFILAKNPQFNLKYVLALLNSKLYYLWFYYKGKRKGEMLELCKKPISDMPIKRISESQQIVFINLVNRILAARSRYPEANVSDLEAEIDQKIYDLYGLTSEERTIVEAAVR